MGVMITKKSVTQRSGMFALVMGSLLISGFQIGFGGCVPVAVNIVNHSTQSYQVAGVPGGNPLVVEKRSYSQGQVESARYYGHQCGLIRLASVDHPNDVRYALISPGTQRVSVVIHQDSTLDTVGLTEQGFNLKDYDEWYGVRKYIT